MKWYAIKFKCNNCGNNFEHRYSIKTVVKNISVYGLNFGYKVLFEDGIEKTQACSFCEHVRIEETDRRPIYSEDYTNEPIYK